MKDDLKQSEELNLNSVIDTNVSFLQLQFSDIQVFSRQGMDRLIKYRQDNMQTTEMLNIRLRPVFDCHGEPYNPKALALIHLN